MGPQIKKAVTTALALAASASFVLVMLVNPQGSVAMANYAVNTSSTLSSSAGQEVSTSDDYSMMASGESYVHEKKKVVVPSISSYAHVVPDPGTAQAIAYEMLKARGWGDDEYACLFQLWARESGWRVNAGNPSSGAYGIPQALPAEKMASAGPDWATNPATQITWGLGYVSGRYGTPCGAWGAFQEKGWY